MVIETVALHGTPCFGRELSGLNGYRRSLDITPLGVVNGHGRRHGAMQGRSRDTVCSSIL
jgi:hypothetical protein